MLRVLHWVLFTCAVVMGCGEASSPATSMSPDPMDLGNPDSESADVHAFDGSSIDAGDTGTTTVDAQGPDQQVDASCLPVMENCDGLDNDCDGTIDEDVVLGDVCIRSAGRCEFDGLEACHDGSIVCRTDATELEIERCDDIGACAEQVQPMLNPMDLNGAQVLEGQFEFGQTHVVSASEDRIAPRVVAEREALVLFTPSAGLAGELTTRLQVSRGDAVLGILPVIQPEDLPTALESELTEAELEPYSNQAYGAYLPWHWVDEGLSLTFVFESGDGQIHMASHTLSSLGAPHRFTLTRTKMVLFGEEGFDTSNTPLEQLGKDFFPALPYAELRMVDSKPWRLDEMVVRTDTGAQLVTSEAERMVAVPDTDHWSIIKNQVALRLSLANTGRGLRLTEMPQGDNSPFSVGTSLAAGWFRGSDGRYRDIDDAPWAAGWTGWTAMWLNQCGNGFIHEVGHSFTMAHFVDGTAQDWGIAAEYPLDGVHLETHPWGYDTINRRFRTWYRVDGNGPVLDENGLVGKRDPMNGGESANAASCFPQYTAYHARKAQRWAQDSPTIRRSGEGAPSVQLWNDETHAYEPYTIEDTVSPIVAMDVPTVTLIGTLGRSDESKQTYPPVFTASGHVFESPDPLGELPADYNGSVYFVTVEYADGAIENGLINRSPVDDSGLYLYALNIDARRQPVALRLMESPTPYPNIDMENAQEHHVRLVGEIPEVLPRVLRFGRGRMDAESISLSVWCDAAYNCHRRSGSAAFRNGTDPVSFLLDGAEGFSTCSPEGAGEAQIVMATDDAGIAHPLSIHMARHSESVDCQRISPANDDTPWCTSANQTQSFEAWIPFEDNSELPTGRYRYSGIVRAFTTGSDGQRTELGHFELKVDLVVPDMTEVDLAQPWRSPAVIAENSSVYYLVRDGRIGPTERVWWDDPNADPVRLRVPMQRASDGTMVTVIVDALHVQCDNTFLDFHAGRGADACQHQAILSIDREYNPELVPGERYETPASTPLVIDARRWHDPDGQAILETYHLNLSYSH